MLDALNQKTGPETNPAPSWKVIRGDAKGYFDLAAFHVNKGANSASYMENPCSCGGNASIEVLTRMAERGQPNRTAAALPLSAEIAAWLCDGTSIRP